MRRPQLVLAIGLAILVSACNSAPITIPPLSEADIPEMDAAANFPPERYRLEPGDAIQIRYTHHPEMSQDDMVRPDGKINAKLVGPIEVAGLTKNELAKMLEQRTADQLKDPEVVISVTRFSDKLVYVAGEVARPGTVPYRKGLTPLQAITASGGFRDTAHYESVILVRTGGSEDKFIARKLDLVQTTNTGMQEPIALAPHDFIFLPRTNIADANIWMRQHVTDMIPLFRGMAISIPVTAF